MKKKISIINLALLGCIAAIIFFIIHAGKNIAASIVTNSYRQPDIKTQLWKEIGNSFSHPLAIFILQLILIIVASQMCAYVFKKIGQPAVMREIIAGILLGPSFLGTISPAFSAFVFPATSLNNLQMLSQVGLILFMFVIGMELDISTFKNKAAATLVISNVSIVIPFCLGVILSCFIYKTYAPVNVPYYAFALFIGIAMSITAFPVLARVIRDRQLTGTKLGNIAITCAAIGDITAWCVLAFIITIVKAGSFAIAIYTILATLAYVIIMLLAVKPLLNHLAQYRTDNKLIKRSTIGFIFIILLLSAYCCEVIGIHALFGAFFAGVIMPVKWNFRKVLIDKIEDIALVLLLPLFFVFTGLRTRIGLLNDPSLWITTFFIIAVAVVGKFGGSAAAARLTGESVKDSLSIGALMNTRGLVELVVLNIGYDLGILGPKIFTMMVIMALVTTFMTGPSLNIINRLYNHKV